MLYEIFCDAFANKKVTFRNGLNAILGNDNGDNSIGKSTFLLIIDFVFGGNTYAEQENITENVQPHDICFSFIFNNTKYYFKRNNIDSRRVNKCTEQYTTIATITIDEYRNWLKESYQLTSAKSFRDFVGRFIRIPGKYSIDLKNPLAAYHQEKPSDSTNVLLQLFDKYKDIDQLKNISDEALEKLRVFKAALKYQFIYDDCNEDGEAKKKNLEEYKDERQAIIKDFNLHILSSDDSATAQAMDLKRTINKLRTKLYSIRFKRKNLEEQLHANKYPTTKDFEQLKVFFPNVNEGRLIEIESFHKGIVQILKGEIQNEYEKNKKLEDNLTAILSETKAKLASIISNPSTPVTILERFSYISREIDNIEEANNNHSKLNGLSEDSKAKKEQYDKMKYEELIALESQLNTKMSDLNFYIYHGNANSPTITFTSTGNYNFSTPNDTGTGRGYKGLIIFDLAILEMTKLPILIHDNQIINQISRDAIEKIFELYTQSEKQIVIAIDKIDTYTTKTQEILKKAEILSLGQDRQALFGKVWK